MSNPILPANRPVSPEEVEARIAAAAAETETNRFESGSPQWSTLMREVFGHHRRAAELRAARLAPEHSGEPVDGA